jgi:hypothetical protein
MFATATLAALASLPVLAPPAPILAAGKPISVQVGHAAPNWRDMNGDGLADLVVGQFGEGRIRVYLNVGTRTEPKFRDFYHLKADGQIIQLDAG